MWPLTSAVCITGFNLIRVFDAPDIVSGGEIWLVVFQAGEIGKFAVSHKILSLYLGNLYREKCSKEIRPCWQKIGFCRA